MFEITDKPYLLTIIVVLVLVSLVVYNEYTRRVNQKIVNDSIFEHRRQVLLDQAKRVVKDDRAAQ